MQKSNIHKKKQPTKDDCCKIFSHKYMSLLSKISTILKKKS